MCAQFQLLANAMSVISSAQNAEHLKSLLANSAEQAQDIATMKRALNDAADAQEQKAASLGDQLDTIESAVHGEAEKIRNEQQQLSLQQQEMMTLLRQHLNQKLPATGRLVKLTGDELQELSGFTRKDSIGTGASSTIYRGKYNGKAVAIKALTHSDNEKKLVRGEVKQLERLKHRNIIAALAWCDDADSCAIVFPLLKPLESVVPSLTDADVLIILIGIAKALCYMHDERRLHRDVKPENILLDYCATASPAHVAHAVLTDLGLSVGLSTMHSVAGTAGTPFYRDPELMKPDAKPSPANDVFSLGITAAVLWRRRLPSAGES